MKRSTERIVTTHVGSLPRPPDLLDMIQAKERGGSFDAAAFAARVKSAVAEVVRRQAEAGIDIIADGEMGRFGFIPYVNERLTGLEARQNLAVVSRLLSDEKAWRSCPRRAAVPAASILIWSTGWVPITASLATSSPARPIFVTAQSTP